jgi:dTMP kinase
MRSNKGFFITFEGGEGAGKSTLMHRMMKKLLSEGYSVVATREPGGTALGEEIRRHLLHRTVDKTIGREAELLLFLAARAQHLEEKILPALSEGKILLCDRFNDSTIAYQGYARGLDIKKVETLCALVSKEAIPDLTFFLDLPPHIGFSRKKSRENGEIDHIESEIMDFHLQVREGLKQLAEKNPERIICIDASLPSDDVFKIAWKHLEERLIG